MPTWCFGLSCCPPPPPPLNSDLAPQRASSLSLAPPLQLEPTVSNARQRFWNEQTHRSADVAPCPWCFKWVGWDWDGMEISGWGRYRTRYGANKRYISRLIIKQTLLLKMSHTFLCSWRQQHENYWCGTLDVNMSLHEILLMHHNIIYVFMICSLW